MNKKATTSVFAAVLSLGLSAQAASVSYKCIGDDADQNIKFNSRTISVTSEDTLNGLKFNAKFDATYKPRGLAKIRFTGQEDGNSRDVILSAEMIKGVKSGYMQIRGSEDGYWSKSYKCSLQ